MGGCARARGVFVLIVLVLFCSPSGRYSVTPEAIAVHVARRVAAAAEPAHAAASTEPGECGGDGDGSSSALFVVDAFCGCGGNAIAFARQRAVRHVVSIDIDPVKVCRSIIWKERLTTYRLQHMA